MVAIRLLIVEDQAIMRDGLVTIFSMEQDFHVVGSASNGKEGYELSIKEKPDVVLMDIRMPKMDGIESIRKIKKAIPNTKVIVLTTFEDDEYVFQAIKYGASGYLLKDLEGSELVQFVRNQRNDHITLPTTIAQSIASAHGNEGHPEWETIKGKFTKRELEVLGEIARGLGNQEIAIEPGVTIGTINNYISVIYDKLEIYDRKKLILYLNSINDFEK